MSNDRVSLKMVTASWNSPERFRLTSGLFLVATMAA